MKEYDMVQEIEEFKGNLNYENLLARAVDRTLFSRASGDLKAFGNSVYALQMALVDMPGKPLRSEIDVFLKDKKESDLVFYSVDLHFLESMFKEVTRILSKYHLLFRSTILETNR